MESNFDPTLEPSESSNFIIWMIVIIIIGLVIGGGYWYYQNKILHRNMSSPSPSPEISVPVWKVHSEKTVNDFLTFWSNSGQNSDGQIQAKKARDLLTIAAQGLIAAYKGSDGNQLTDVSIQLDRFIGLNQETKDFKLISTKQINDSTVEAKVNFNVGETKQKLLILKYQDNMWLIDSITEAIITVSPSPSISPSISVTPTKTL